ncbi:MAG: TIGR04551 family protein [Polyangiaceae bacterium]|nr:TIGR04551 family protein [Polyangiaceae bacterium]
MSRASAWLIASAIALASADASASGLTDYGSDLRAPDSVLRFDGYFRTRGALLYNLDLDRGPTPSGQVLFPVPLERTGQWLTMADMRGRADIGIFAPWGDMAIKSRIDVLDNVALGSAPEGIPAASTTQSTDPWISLRRLYGEVLTPLGLLSVGRMGAHWGLGMLANGGDCLDCDEGDSADRIAFVTPLVGHLWAIAYDFSATGPFEKDRTGSRVIDVEPSAMVHTFSFMFANYRGPDARARRSAANKITPEYGVLLSYRFQDGDVPSTYVPTAEPVPLGPGQVMSRGYDAAVADLWLRFEGNSFRIEAEGAYQYASVEQASLVPGALYREPVTSNAVGVALESEFGDDEDRFRAGLDAGFASGDEAPGFGAFPPAIGKAPVPGDIEGPQANPPFDRGVNNFRFSPDYRIDRVLFREILGTVTDTIYFKPHVRYDVYSGMRGKLTLGLAVVTSLAAVPSSTPSGERPLGVEIDPTIAYASDVGFSAAVEQGTLIPLSGLDGPGLPAQPAQVWRLRLTYAFGVGL